MTTRYQIHDFAQLAGVTVKALHHYDRLGLLKPARTEAGYRVYSEHDLERLEQIVALKFLGFPLRQMKDALDRSALDWAGALRVQREAMEAQHAQLGRAVRAIRTAEAAMADGQQVSATLLKQIIAEIEMQDSVELMKTYYSDEAWEQRRQHYEHGPLPEWRELYRDIAALLGSDPASAEGQAVADRWLKLSVKSAAGVPEAQTDSMKAWMDREHWPPTMKRRLAEFKLEDVTEFIKQAMITAPQKYFGADAWVSYVALKKRPLEERSRAWQAKVDLFRYIDTSLDRDSDPSDSVHLADRWLAAIDMESAGDAAVKACLLNMWADRANWSASLRWQTEALFAMPSDRFERAAAAIHRAIKVRANGMNAIS